MTTSMPPFHLAIPVDDLVAAAAFYGDLLGCPRGREADRWIDWDFFGHQLVTHLASSEQAAPTNPVDGKQVPARHFGVVIDEVRWRELADRFASAGVDFLIKPGVRFQGEAGEQGTFFVKDPAGNALEFKYFADMGQLFATD